MSAGQNPKKARFDPPEGTTWPRSRNPAEPVASNTTSSRVSTSSCSAVRAGGAINNEKTSE
ncbi:hypothetical protein EB061_02520 [bacterium]|nr:hypothetical protein [bacterium]